MRKAFLTFIIFAICSSGFCAWTATGDDITTSSKKIGRGFVFNTASDLTSTHTAATLTVGDLSELRDVRVHNNAVGVSTMTISIARLSSATLETQIYKDATTSAEGDFFFQPIAPVILGVGDVVEIDLRMATNKSTGLVLTTFEY